MNDPRYRFHAVSHRDFTGDIPGFLPREEEDFPSEAAARSWLEQRGYGGTIEFCRDPLIPSWVVREHIPPRHVQFAFAA